MRIIITSFAGILLALPFAASWAAGGSTTQFQIVDQRGIPVRDAVVEIEPSGGYSGPVRFPWRAAMAQKSMAFTPGTLIVAKGSTVVFPNLDRVRHSIYSFSKPARFESNLFGRDQSFSHRMTISGTVSVGCNIHDGMRGYVRVVDTPYAGKTDHNGYLSVSGAPTGRANVTVWHPRLRGIGNERTGTVAMTGGGVKKITIKLR